MRENPNKYGSTALAAASLQRTTEAAYAPIKKKQKETSQLILKDYYDLLSLKLGFVLAVDQVNLKVGVPGKGKLSGNWTGNLCAKGKDEKLLQELDRSSVKSGMEGFFNLTLKNLSSEIKKSRTKNNDNLVGYLEASPELISKVLHSYPYEKYGPAICETLLKANATQKLKNMAKTAVSVAAVGTSIALGFTGIGTPVSTMLLASTIGLTGVEVKLLYDQNQEIKKRVSNFQNLVVLNEDNTGEYLRRAGIAENTIKSNNNQMMFTAIATVAPPLFLWIGKSIKAHPLVKTLVKSRNKNAQTLIGLSDSEAGALINRGAKKISEMSKDKKIAQALQALNPQDVEMLNLVAGSMENEKNLINVIERLSSMKPGDKSQFLQDLFSRMNTPNKTGLSISSETIDEVADSLLKRTSSMKSKKPSSTTSLRSEKGANQILKINNVSVSDDYAKFFQKIGMNDRSEIYSFLERKFPNGLPADHSESEKLKDIILYVYGNRKSIHFKPTDQFKNFDDLFDDLWSFVTKGESKKNIVKSNWYAKYQSYQSKWKGLEDSALTKAKGKKPEEVLENIRNLKYRNASCKSPENTSFMKDLGSFTRDSMLLGFIIGNLTLTFGTEKGRKDLTAGIKDVREKGDWTKMMKNVEYYQLFEGFWNVAWAFTPPVMKFFGNGNPVIEGAVSHVSNLGLTAAYSNAYFRFYGNATTEENKLDHLKKILNEKAYDGFISSYGNKIKEIAKRENSEHAFIEISKQLMDVKGDEFDKFLGNVVPGMDLTKISKEQILANKDLLKVYERAVLEGDYEVNGSTLNKVFNTGSFENDMTMFNEFFGYTTIPVDTVVWGHIRHLYCLGMLKKARAMMAAYKVSMSLAYWGGREMVLPKNKD